MSYIDDVAKYLDLPPSTKAQVLEELEDHYSQLHEQFIAAGQTPDQADKESSQVLGDPRKLALHLQSVHMKAGWKSAFLTAVPFLLLGLLPLMKPFQGEGFPDVAAIRVVVIAGAVLLLLAGIAMYCISLREIIRDRRPPWLATWLAVGVSLPILIDMNFYEVFSALRVDYLRYGLTARDIAIVYPYLSLALASLLARGIKKWSDSVPIILALLGIVASQIVFSYLVKGPSARILIII